MNFLAVISSHPGGGTPMPDSVWYFFVGLMGTIALIALLIAWMDYRDSKHK